MIQSNEIIFTCFLLALNSRVFAGPNAYTKWESENACAFAKSMSILSYPGLARSNFVQQTLMQTCPAVGLFSEMGGEGARLVLSQLSPCHFDTSSEENFAKSFTIEKFLPGGKKEFYTGIEFLRKCRTRNTEKLKYNNQWILLMHGWQVKCSKSDILANWGERDAQVLADKLVAVVYVFCWPACCNYFEIVHCNWNSITNLIANFLIKGAENEQHPPLEYLNIIGHSLGGRLAGHVSQKITERTGIVCELACALDPAGPGFETFYSRGECQGMHKNVAKRTMVVHTDPNILGTNTKLCLAQVIIICTGLENYPQNSIKTPGFKHLFACNEFMYAFARNITINATRVGDPCNTKHSITFYKKMVPGVYMFDSKHNPEMARFETTRPMRLFGSPLNSWF